MEETLSSPTAAKLGVPLDQPSSLRTTESMAMSRRNSVTLALQDPLRSSLRSSDVSLPLLR
jgi:hypothetical protein